MKRIALLSLIRILLPSLGALAQSPAAPRAEPWDHDLYIQESTNGVDFATSKVFIERADAACAVRDAEDRLVAAFQWFPSENTNAFDRVAVVFSTDDGATWSKPQPVVMRGVPGGYERPRAPTLVVLENGKLRLYFTSCPTLRSRQQGIYSAFSSDGLHYVFEPGMRFGVEDGKTSVMNCAVARSGKRFHLYAPVPGQAGRGYHATSGDGLKFQIQAGVTIAPPREWLGNVVAYRDGLGFYGSSPEGIWVGFSRDGATWQLNPRNGERGGDPAVVSTKAGRVLRIYTGPPRHDADK